MKVSETPQRVCAPRVRDGTGREGQSRQIPAGAGAGAGGGTCPRRSAICVRGLTQVSRGFLCFLPRLSTLFCLFFILRAAFPYIYCSRLRMHMHEIVLFCSVLFGFERSLCIFIRVCQIDPNQRFHFKGACGQTNGSYIHTPNDLLQKLFIEEKGKVCIHVSVMCMSTTHLAMCLCSSAGRRMERFCAFLSSLPPSLLICLLSSATLAASGVRWAAVRPDGVCGHVVCPPSWSWSCPCHDQPTNFLVLPTFAMFSAH